MLRGLSSESARRGERLEMDPPLRWQRVYYHVCGDYPLHIRFLNGPRGSDTSCQTRTVAVLVGDH
jgi:hypothetical protein